MIVVLLVLVGNLLKLINREIQLSPRPLIVAVGQKHVDIAAMLIAAGADVNVVVE